MWCGNPRGIARLCEPDNYSRVAPARADADARQKHLPAIITPLPAGAPELFAKGRTARGTRNTDRAEGAAIREEADMKAEAMLRSAVVAALLCGGAYQLA